MPFHAAEIQIQVVPESDVVERVASVEQLVARGKLDGLVGLVGIVAIVATIDVHVDPAQRVRDVLESLKIYLQILIDIDVCELLHRLHRQGGTAVCIGCVELAGAVTGYLNLEVPR